MYRRFTALSGLLLLAAQAQAGITIDNFGKDSNGYTAPTLTAYDGGPYGAQLTASATGNGGIILGGSRDATAHVIGAVAYPGDNPYVNVNIVNGTYLGPFLGMDFSMDYAGTGAFSLVYDGAGVGNSAAGLNYDLGATGDRITIQVLQAAALDGLGGNPLIPLSVALTDTAGHSALLTRQALSANTLFQSFDYLFSGFQGQNAALDLAHIDKIEVSSQYTQASGLRSYFALGNIGTTGDAYVAPLGASAAPEPAAWMTMIAGFGLVGAAMRRRQTTKVAFA